MLALFLASILCEGGDLVNDEDMLAKGINFTIVPEKVVKPDGYAGGFTAAVLIAGMFGVVGVIVAVVSTIVFVRPLIAESRDSAEFDDFSE